MKWVETDTSENGDRWTLENPLGVPVSLAVEAGYYRIRVNGQKYEVHDAPTLDRAKARAVEALRWAITRALVACDVEEG